MYVLKRNIAPKVNLFEKMGLYKSLLLAALL